MFITLLNVDVRAHKSVDCRSLFVGIICASVFRDPELIFTKFPDACFVCQFLFASLPTLKRLMRNSWLCAVGEMIYGHEIRFAYFHLAFGISPTCGEGRV